MDLKMPTSNEIWTIEPRLPVPVIDNTDPNHDSTEEVRGREDLAAELEAMMDAAVEAEAAETEACIKKLGDEMDMDIDQTKDADPKSNLPEQQEYEQPRPTRESANVLPSNDSPLLSAAPLMSAPAPRYPYLHRSMRVPVSPAQKIIAQQFLTESRTYLKQTSAGGRSRLGDEEKEAANLNIQSGTGRDIPEPAVFTQSPAQYAERVRQRSDTSQMIPAPADDPGMHLNEMWRNMNRPSTVDERRTFYGNSRRRKRQQKSSSL